MSDEVKPKRRYDAARRREQAEDNRLRILRAAVDLFGRDGYQATSLAAVAKAAGVSVPTVYAAFASKVNLLKHAVDVAVVGDDEPVPLADRPSARDVAGAPDAATALARYAALCREVAGRLGPLLVAVEAGAAADPAVAGLARDLDAQRLRGMTAFAATLAAKPGVAPGVGEEEIRDLLWTFNSPQLYDLYVNRRGWSLERYETWIARQWVRLLTDRAGPDGDRPA